METITLRAHFDGKKIVLKEPIFLPAHIDLFVTLQMLPLADTLDETPDDAPDDMLDSEREDWYRLSLQGLYAAYDDDEPDYPVSLIKEPNPTYEGR
jgi:hypothetical protein